MTKRLYRVHDVDGKAFRLVDATNVSTAIRHCAQLRYSAAPATPRDVADLVAKGVKVEVAGEEVDA